MAAFIRTILPCLPIPTRGGRIQLPADLPPNSEKHPLALSTPYEVDHAYHLRCDTAASTIVDLLMDVKVSDPTLHANIASIVHEAGGWSQYLATKILAAIEVVLKAGKGANFVLKNAYDKAIEAAKIFEKFAADHPLAMEVFVTVIAIGILVVLAPYVVEWLGFAELGPVEGNVVGELLGKNVVADVS